MQLVQRSVTFKLGYTFLFHLSPLSVSPQDKFLLSAIQPLQDNTSLAKDPKHFVTTIRKVDLHPTKLEDNDTLDKR